MRKVLNKATGRSRPYRPQRRSRIPQLQYVYRMQHLNPRAYGPNRSTQPSPATRTAATALKSNRTRPPSSTLGAPAMPPHPPPSATSGASASTNNFSTSTRPNSCTAAAAPSTRARTSSTSSTATQTSMVPSGSPPPWSSSCS